jgi:hypothetical protein
MTFVKNKLNIAIKRWFQNFFFIYKKFIKKIEGKTDFNIQVDNKEMLFK